MLIFAAINAAIRLLRMINVGAQSIGAVRMLVRAMGSAIMPGPVAPFTGTGGDGAMTVRVCSRQKTILAAGCRHVPDAAQTIAAVLSVQTTIPADLAPAITMRIRAWTGVLFSLAAVNSAKDGMELIATAIRYTRIRLRKARVAEEIAEIRQTIY